MHTSVSWCGGLAGYNKFNQTAPPMNMQTLISHPQINKSCMLVLILGSVASYVIFYKQILYEKPKFV